MIVPVAEMRAVLDRLFTHLEQAGVESVDLEHDLYWNVPADGRYDPYREPEQLDLGQLSEDWRELQRIRTGDAEPTAYALVWAAAILRAMGEDAIA